MRRQQERNSEGKIPSSIENKLCRDTGMNKCSNIAEHRRFRYDKILWLYRGQCCLIVRSGKRRYAGIREEDRSFCPEKKSGLEKGFLESALLSRLMRTEAGKSKGVLII